MGQLFEALSPRHVAFIEAQKIYFVGTAAEGTDPTVQAWALNPLGWFLVLMPFGVFIIGIIVGALRRKRENVDAIADLVS